jgi:hypothetical protein
VQILPPEQPILGGIPAEVEQAGLRVVEVRVAPPLVLEESLELPPEPVDPGPVLDRRIRRVPIALATEAERLALSPKTTMTTR